MQTKNTNPRKPSKFIELKLLLTALSMAVTVGLWNLFSSNAVQAEKARNLPPSPPPAPVVSQDLSSLPTLVPLISVSDQPTAAGDNPAATDKPTLKLRSVSAPSQTIVQKGHPVVDQPGVVVITSGGGSSQGVTSTRSSH